MTSAKNIDFSLMPADL